MRFCRISQKLWYACLIKFCIDPRWAIRVICFRRRASCSKFEMPNGSKIACRPVSPNQKPRKTQLQNIPSSTNRIQNPHTCKKIASLSFTNSLVIDLNQKTSAVDCALEYGPREVKPVYNLSRSYSPH